ncbi:hypothetical protein [Actinoplanes sp. URMC 104]|uniref:hypothetical protein n=1 Tax=Actinoplanes sp. URMC 104 TaxID=3423409 RepID=UPI003F1C5908
MRPNPAANADPPHHASTADVPAIAAPAGPDAPILRRPPLRQPSLNADAAEQSPAAVTGSDNLSVGDPATLRTRLLTRMCHTCVFRPGNLMQLSQGRLHELVEQARQAESYIICHSTLPGMAPDDVAPAVCRGFADRYSTQALQAIERLFGFTEIEPPPKSTP